jgi:uncharacterized repeat protein (TIGR03803 family)
MNKPNRVGLAAARMFQVLVASIVLVLAGWAFNASGQTLTTLYNFTLAGGTFGTNGVFPNDRLVQGTDRNFYGTTYEGGAYDVGTVFRITPSGSVTNLHSFRGSGGAFLFSGLVQGSDGNFYGTTIEGGTNICSCGTVFRITPSGNFTNIYSFDGSAGSRPRGALVQGSDGNFYGAAGADGANGAGTIFRITPSGNLTNLHSFSGIDGNGPNGSLVQGSDGNFYGMTYSGGASNFGTVFRITPSGCLTGLYSFSGLDGAYPYFDNGLVQGSDGNFYGTTSEGGANNTGTVFRITASGTLTTLYSFSGLDGDNPGAELVHGSDGNFYGTTIHGGASNFGTVFRITSSGYLTNLYSFSGSDGAAPYAGLVQGSDGNFYGTTYSGGTNISGGEVEGTVFKLSVPLNPPANQISAVQIAGNDVTMSVPSVASETYQLQFTTDLTSGVWSNVPGVAITNSIGALLTLTNFGAAAGPQGFYRFAITP